MTAATVLADRIVDTDVDIDSTLYDDTSIDEVELDDDRTPDDFDMARIVDELPLKNVTEEVEQLRAQEGPYVAACRRAGKRVNATSEFYHVANRCLFLRKARMQEELAEMERVPVEDRTFQQRGKLRRLRRELDTMVTVIVAVNYGMTRKYVRLFTSTTTRDIADDFQAAALVGLMTSIDTFDPERGRFGSWAYKRIQREVLRAVRDADFANMNHGDFEKRPDVLRAKAKLAGPDDSYSPTFEEIAQEAGCTVDMVRRVLNAPHLESLQAPIGSGGDAGGALQLGDVLPDWGPPVDTVVTDALDVNALMTYGLPVLTDREHYVLVRRFGLDNEPVQCLSSIAKQLRLSREAVRQVEGKAMAKLLHPIVLRRILRHGRPVGSAAYAQPQLAS